MRVPRIVPQPFPRRDLVPRHDDQEAVPLLVQRAAELDEPLRDEAVDERGVLVPPVWDGFPMMRTAISIFRSQNSACSDTSTITTTWLVFVRLVDKSKGPESEHLALDKPELGLRCPLWEKPPAPAHDEGLD